MYAFIIVYLGLHGIHGLIRTSVGLHGLIRSHSRFSADITYFFRAGYAAAHGMFGLYENLEPQKKELLY